MDAHAPMSIREQCGLLGLSRSACYEECRPESAENLALMRRLDALHLEHPVYGSRKLASVLANAGLQVNRKRVGRLRRRMGIEASYPKTKTSEPGGGHRIYPCLLKGLAIKGPDEVWCAGIPCIPRPQGFRCLVAGMDWWSRCGRAWEIANTLESDFCARAWERALAQGRRAPDIANTDQGSQFTSAAHLEAVASAGAAVSLDGRGRWLDNRFSERRWRRVKYEDVSLRDYLDGPELGRGLGRWFADYNQSRPQPALNYACPEDGARNPEAHGARTMKG